MAKIIQELALCLPALSKAVFSQPVEKTGAQKLMIRPVLLKGERLYQVESFRDNKAYHQNLSADALLRWAEANARGPLSPGPAGHQDGEPPVYPQARRQL